MDRYQCHKVVEATRILGWDDPNIERAPVGRSFRLESGEAFTDQDGEWTRRHQPTLGGYLVKYEDGYTSFSPAGAFEAGYTRLHPEPAGAAMRYVDPIAKVCHEVNRAYSLSIGEDPARVYPSWDEAPDSIRASARIGVCAALEGATPEQLHESWLETKARDGWIYGPVKDLATKQHPCCVPYAELPVSQRVKDALFAAVVKAARP